MSYGADWQCACGWANLDVRAKCRHCGEPAPVVDWRTRAVAAEATLAAAETQMRAMREALAECIDTLALVEHPAFIDPVYGDAIKRLGDSIGYGALMAGASAAWRESVVKSGYPSGGEFVAGPCHVTVVRALGIARAALAPVTTPPAETGG